MTQTKYRCVYFSAYKNDRMTESGDCFLVSMTRILFQEPFLWPLFASAALSLRDIGVPSVEPAFDPFVHFCVLSKCVRMIECVGTLAPVLALGVGDPAFQVWGFSFGHNFSC